MDGDFLHALLHDLNGPVARIRMLGELLTRHTGSADEETQRLVTYIGASVASAEGVLEALRRYTNVVASSFQPERFDLALAVDTAIHRLEAQLASSGAQVTRSPLLEVYGDRAQIAILFQELIANAVHFRSAAPPAIEIALASSEPDSCSISVIDNGMGLGNLDAERIFRPFVKTSGRARPGMGLAICSRIATLHGGGIVAMPRAQGLEFRLSLPRPS